MHTYRRYILYFLLLLAGCSAANVEPAADVAATGTVAEVALAQAATATPSMTATAPPSPTATATPEPTQTATRRATSSATPTEPLLTPAADTIKVTATIEAIQMSPTTPAGRAGGDEPAVPDSLLSLTERIVSDIQTRSGAARSAIVLQSFEEVVWNDGSLGCPQPGMMYTQALVSGFRFVYTANGKVMAYHSNGSRHFVYCDTRLRPGGGFRPGGGD